MKSVLQYIYQDYKRLFQARIIQMVFIISFIFGMMIVIFPTFDPANVFYLSVFILPVIVFAISMYIEKEEQAIYPIAYSKQDAIKMVLSKIASSLSLMLLPVLFFFLVIAVTASTNIQYVLLFIAYVVGALLHILIGLFISMASKTTKVLAASYITYVLVFSITPILYANGIIPYSMQYIMIISPAFLSGILIENILAGVWYSQPWLLILAGVLQIVYIFLLYVFAVRPHFLKYLLQETPQ